MHCLVTGANGYIGRGLLSALFESGCSVSAQTRPGSPPLFLASGTHYQCDFGAGDWDLPLEGVDVLFHLAGIAHQQGDVGHYQAVNVDATLALANKALSAGVRRFVFISSVKAGAAERDSEGELLPLAESRNPYAQSKALAEAGLEARCQGADTELIIVRPALVYSEDAPGHLRWLRRWTRLHLPAPPPGGERSMIALADLLALLTHLKNAPLREQTRVTVTDGERYSTRRLHKALCAAGQTQPWCPSPPALFWKAACALLDGIRGESRGSTWARMTGDECYPSSGLDALGFHPRLNFESSLGVSIDAP
ncbi:Nucleoside-diphosphate-sugar epimerase [Congregibacter litoralis KT71]|uniref:Nucleoside-diphosphate-sugar epimerase n=1 Tax=Congregibacter litoralis KT71 TaxID=314285 RepID=A4AAS5_9GAMM|nr:Nucleoside-diphosphate-sugar epimerase [Congregibacter litoralis KT71]